MTILLSFFHSEYYPQVLDILDATLILEHGTFKRKMNFSTWKKNTWDSPPSPP